MTPGIDPGVQDSICQKTDSMVGLNRDDAIAAHHITTLLLLSPSVK